MNILNRRNEYEYCYKIILEYCLMMKDILFALELGVKVIGVFIFMTYIGIKLNQYFDCWYWILICIIFAFIYVMKLLLGVGKNG